MNTTRLWIWSRQLISFIRPEPFDVTTSNGRTRERNRRIALTAIIAAVAKGISVATLLISVPLTLNYLGVERYGLWATTSSFAAMLAFADLGMGNGLLTAISAANGKDDRNAAIRYVSSAFFMLACIALLLALGFSLLYSTIPWPRIFNVKTSLASSEAGPVMAVFMACFITGIPLGIVQRVQLGYQEGFANSLWNAATSVAVLLAVLVAIYLQVSLPWLVIALAGTPIFILAIQGIFVFGFRYKWLRPKISKFDRNTAVFIFRTGLLFLVLQVCIALAYSTDNIVIAQLLGPQAVAEYSIASRLFSIPTLILNMLLLPLWPAYGEAIARGDIIWVQSTLKRSLISAVLVTGTFSVVLIAFGTEIVGFWAGSSVAPAPGLLIGLGVWTILASLGTTVAMFLNGAHIIKFQAICALFMTIGAVFLKIFLTQRIGVSGIPWGVAVSYFLFVVIPTAIYLPSVISKVSSGKNSSTI